jgi:nickel transport protein
MTTASRRRTILVLAVGAIQCLIPPACRAHEVHATVSAAGATVIRIAYGDGDPFACEKYELTPEGSTGPAQTGRTDASGRVLFLAGDQHRWHLRAYSEDGHGVDMIVETSQAGSDSPDAQNTAVYASSRWYPALAGLLILLAVFSGLTWWVRRRPGA